VTDPFTGDTADPAMGANPALRWGSGFVVSYNGHPEFNGVNLVGTNFDTELRFDSLGRPKDGSGALFLVDGTVVVQYPATSGYSRTVTITRETGQAFIS
jgi:hypothetical protein